MIGKEFNTNNNNNSHNTPTHTPVTIINTISNNVMLALAVIRYPTWLLL